MAFKFAGAVNVVPLMAETRLLDLPGKQAADLKTFLPLQFFWGAYVKDDPSSLQELCTAFEHYTVETLL